MYFLIMRAYKGKMTDAKDIGDENLISKHRIWFVDLALRWCHLKQPEVYKARTDYT